MELGKEAKKKINVLEAMHYIMAAWQQASQQTIQNCFRKAGHKYQSEGNEMANDDDDDISAKNGKNCVEPRNTISKATSQWITMWQQVALKLLKNYAKHLGLQGV
jgi:isopenicillin N synthase-like dioxygenase